MAEVRMNDDDDADGNNDDDGRLAGRHWLTLFFNIWLKSW